MKRPGRTEPPETRLFAWDGLSWRMPADWDLSSYSFGRNTARASFEDGYALRLEAEWTRPARVLDPEKIRRRYATRARAVTRTARHATQLAPLPPGWTGFLYSFPTGRRLITAFVLGPGSNVFCFFQIHFTGQDPGNPAKVLKTIAQSFSVHQAPLVPWSVYDVTFELPPQFKLFSSSLEAGRKLLVFHHRLRRLYVWHFSLAHILLRDANLQDWAAEFLNTFKPIKGPTFFVSPDGSVRAKRSRRYRLGHADEISRWCFHYHVRCEHLADKDQIALWLYNYRKPADLELVRDVFRDDRPTR